MGYRPQGTIAEGIADAISWSAGGYEMTDATPRRQ